MQANAPSILVVGGMRHRAGELAHHPSIIWWGVSEDAAEEGTVLPHGVGFVILHSKLNQSRKANVRDLARDGGIAAQNIIQLDDTEAQILPKLKQLIANGTTPEAQPRKEEDPVQPTDTAKPRKVLSQTEIIRKALSKGIEDTDRIHERVLKHHPHVTRPQLQATMSYARRTLKKTARAPKARRADKPVKHRKPNRNAQNGFSDLDYLREAMKRGPKILKGLTATPSITREEVRQIKRNRKLVQRAVATLGKVVKLLQIAVE